jgi:hypothetical protein
MNGDMLADRRECETMEEEGYAKTCKDCSCFVDRVCVAGKLNEVK